MRFLLEVHIKGKMGELSVAYNQLALRLPEDKEIRSLKDALSRAVTEGNQRNDILMIWKSSRTLVAGAIPLVIGWITSWLGTDNFLAALPRLGILIEENLLSGNSLLFFRFLSWAVISLSLLFLLFNQAFEGKRIIFLPVFTHKRINVPTHNTCTSEDDLFQRIGRQKTPEFAVDLAAGLFFLGLLAAGHWLRTNFYPSSNYHAWIAWPVLVLSGVAMVTATRQCWR